MTIRRELLEGNGIRRLRDHTFTLDTALAQIRRNSGAAMTSKRERASRAGVTLDEKLMGGCEEPAYDYLVTEDEVVASIAMYFILKYIAIDATTSSSVTR